MKKIAIAALLTVIAIPGFSQTNLLNQSSFDAPLNKPALSNQAVIDWTMTHVELANELSETNVHQWSEKVKPFFTKKGFQTFSQTLPLKTKQYAVSAKPSGQTQIITQGTQKTRLSLNKGTYTWYVLVPITKSVVLPRSEVITQDICMLKVVRVGKKHNADLIAIDNVECTNYAKTDVHPVDPTPDMIKKIKTTVKLKS